MARKTVKVRRNRDGTITVRVANMVEHISIEAKSKGEIFDAVKYASLSKGVYIHDEELTELLYTALHEGE